MGAVLPPTIGAGVAALTSIGLRQFMQPTSETQIRMMQYAPWIGLGTGTLVALMLRNTIGRAAGWGTFAGAAGVTIAMAISEMSAKNKLAAHASGETIDAMKPYGLGAIVPEYGSGRGLGAIVMEPQASRGYGAGQLGSYGETVNLGNINTSAFGTPGFTT